jgi:8-oxo-dGTP pyrophosphatase MutT (NUDIX family)
VSWREAAVILAIFADQPHHVIFIERAAHLRHHAGQIGLPGGTTDPIDGGDPATTALRELHEELNVDPSRVRIVGRLPQHKQISNRFLVTPVVGIVEPETALTIDHAETVGVFTVPLATIVAPNSVYDDAAMRKIRGMEMYALDYGDHHIWGLTGRILKTFVDTWNEPDSALRSEIEAAFIKP